LLTSPPSKETQKKPTPGKEKKRLERWKEREIENRKDLKDGEKGERKGTQRKEET
jgi:hypothetical protein